MRGPETELMKINCPGESREKMNLSTTYLIQYRVLRQPPASPDPAQRRAPASTKKKHSILSHCPASSSQLCIMMYVWYLYPIYVLPSKQEEGNSDGTYLTVGRVNWETKSGKKGRRSENRVQCLSS